MNHLAGKGTIVADPTRRPQSERPDVELELLLDDLATRISFPPTPEIAAAVRQELAARPSAPRSAEPRRGWWPAILDWLRPDRAGGWRRLAATAAIAVVLVVGLLALIPGTRDTVAGWFGVRGIRIVFEEETPTPAATPVGTGLLLGEPLSLEEAQAQVDFPIVVPSLPNIGTPDEIYLRMRPEGGMVSFLYRPRPGLPDAAGSGVGLLLIQFEAPSDAIWGAKNVTDSNDVDHVYIGRLDGLWIGGTHQLLIYPDPVGALRTGSQPQSRTSANVLLWQRGPVTYRLESSMSRTEMIAIAESLMAGSG